MQIRQVIRPHQPDKPHPRIQRLQPRQRLCRMAGAKVRFQIGNPHARVLHDLPGAGHPLVKWRWTGLFQGVPRTDKPPQLIQSKPLERLAAEVGMTGVGRVE